MAPGIQAEPAAAFAYSLKTGPYSSHTLLLNAFPQEGRQQTVLDVGCGAGYLAENLSERGYRVTAIDRVAPLHPRGFEFVEADLDEGLPSLERRFDWILCADILEHLRDPMGMVRGLRAVLEPGGRILASLPNSGHAYFRWHVLLGRFPDHDKGLFDRTHLHFYTWDGWVELFEKTGLWIEPVAVTGAPVALVLSPWEDARWVGALESASFHLARCWKRMFAYQFIVVASV